jgi:hypothetical protein
MSRAGLLFALLGASVACHAESQYNNEWRSGQNEPRAAEIPLYAGARVGDVLDALKAKGFHIKYSSDMVLPTMTLLERPKATRIDDLLREILAPFDLRASRGANGLWVVGPIKKKKKDKVPTPVAQATN